MTNDEAVAIVDMFRPALARGWVPRLSDIEAALEQVRRERAASAPIPVRVTTAPARVVSPHRHTMRRRRRSARTTV